MPKLKTKKAVKKRFKITGRGKVLYHHAGRRHLLGDKGAARKRKLRRGALAGPTDEHRVKARLPYL